MKTRRFFSLFLMLILSVSLCAAPASAAEGVGVGGVEPPELHCDAMLLVDAHTGQTVYGKNEHQEMYPASLTKIMTALLVLEAVDDGRLSLDQQLTASESAMAGLDADGSSADIQAGEILTVEQLLECMLIVSANEACNILGGSRQRFRERLRGRHEREGRRPGMPAHPLRQSQRPPRQPALHLRLGPVPHHRRGHEARGLPADQ